MMKIVVAAIAGTAGLTMASVVSFSTGFGAGYGTGVGVGYCAGGGGSGNGTIVQAPTPTPTSPSTSSPSPGSGSELALSTTLGAATNTSLWQAVDQVGNDNNRLTLSMLMGSWIESRWHSNDSGGGAYGPFQIQQPADNPTGTVVHPDITVAQAEDPVYATNYMAGRYRAAVSQVPDNLWRTNSEAAAEQAVIGAESPAQPYHVTQGQAAVAQAYRASITIMQQVLGAQVDFTQLPVDNGTGSADCSITGDSTNPILFTGDVSDKRDRQIVVAAAERWLRTPYSYAGGNAQGPTLGICTNDAGWNDCHIVGFDCSGLVLYAFAQDGFNFPHLAAGQYQETRGFTVVAAGQPPTNAKPGDLVFFEGAEAPGHVAIYLGNGEVIQAPQSGDIVKITPLSAMSPFTAITDPFAWRDSLKLK